jgi:hypothetical protein
MPHPISNPPVEVVPRGWGVNGSPPSAVHLDAQVPDAYVHARRLYVASVKTPRLTSRCVE